MNKFEETINKIKMNITNNTKKDELIDKLILTSFPLSLLTLLISISYPPLGLINMVSLLLPNLLTFIRLMNYNTKKLKNDIFYIDYMRYEEDFNLEKVRDLRKKLETESKEHSKIPTTKYGISGLLTIIASILGIGLTTSLTMIYLCIAIYIIAFLVEGNLVIKSFSNYKDANSRLTLIIAELENIKKAKLKEKELKGKESKENKTFKTMTYSENLDYETSLETPKVLRKTK